MSGMTYRSAGSRSERRQGPPESLRQTLELPADLPREAVFIQYNDRAPQFLFPKFVDRGYMYDTVETDESVVTVIWAARGD